MYLYLSTGIALKQTQVSAPHHMISFALQLLKSSGMSLTNPGQVRRDTEGEGHARFGPAASGGRARARRTNAHRPQNFQGHFFSFISMPAVVGTYHSLDLPFAINTVGNSFCVNKCGILVGSWRYLLQQKPRYS